LLPTGYSATHVRPVAPIGVMPAIKTQKHHKSTKKEHVLVSCE